MKNWIQVGHQKSVNVELLSPFAVHLSSLTASMLGIGVAKSLGAELKAPKVTGPCM